MVANVMVQKDNNYSGPYFTTLYFKTTLDYKTTQFGPKVPILCVK